MDIKERTALITRNAEEIIGQEKLGEILEKKKPVTYCGYETSGEIHLGHLVTITKLMDLQKAGFHVKVLFADWHTWLNRKGDWDFIHKQTKIWEKGFKAAGLTKAEFILGSSFQRNLSYIDDVLLLSLQSTINRALRSMQQVARDIENAKVSQVIYPFMQIVDIKHLGIDLVEAGIEQRKIHMLGQELFPAINYSSPVFVHTPLIPSLKGPGKMSSSEPSSMISIRDTDKDITSKINKAYCPEGQADGNPILEIMRLIIFPRYQQVTIKRKQDFGGNLNFTSFRELETAFKTKKLHPADLKQATAGYLAEILAPIRKEFS
jgi:tyrosyl-tRNA synthetase